MSYVYQCFEGASIIPPVYIIFTLTALLVLLVIAIRHAFKTREYKSAQEKLMVLNELTQANKELETFSYFTAHDLKEPLRTISCFSSILEQDDTAELTDEQRQYLAVMKSSALRMNSLINDLLDYLNKGDREKIELESVNTKDQLGLVLNDLKLAINESGTHIEVDPMPVIIAHAPSFRRIMQNLIANAIKYRKPDDVLHIKLTGNLQDKEWVFEVQDNGMGFDMAHAQTVLEPFKRLHNRQDIEGSGMGLSICKKLLERLGGRIWVRSQVGVGTTVYFSIPNSQ